MEEDMREKYESLALAELRAIAKSRGMKGVTTMKKADLIELMLAEDDKDSSLPQVPNTLLLPLLSLS